MHTQDQGTAHLARWQVLVLKTRRGPSPRPVLTHSKSRLRAERRTFGSAKSHLVRTVARRTTLWPWDWWGTSLDKRRVRASGGREETAGSQDLEANSTNQPTPCPLDLRIKCVAHNGSTVDRGRARSRSGTSEFRCVGPQRPKAHSPDDSPSSSALRDTRCWSSSAPASTGSATCWTNAIWSSNCSKLLEAAPREQAVPYWRR